VIALAAGLVARATELKEDASLAAFFLISLALGVTIVSMRGSNIDLLHFLFGTVLALDDQTLILIATIASITLAALALIYRPLVLECVDPGYLRSVSRAGGPAHIAFLALVVINLVCRLLLEKKKKQQRVIVIRLLDDVSLRARCIAYSRHGL